MNSEEQELYEHLKNLKEGYDKLYVIYEELDDLVKMGYDGPFMGEEIHGLLHSLQEFKRWKNVSKL